MTYTQMIDYVIYNAMSIVWIKIVQKKKKRGLT